jgi:1,2-diacylglycerol 3-beta-glucosyltransferase
MTTIVLSILGIYVLMHLIMLAGIIVNKRRRGTSAIEPFVSIVICAKDEEDSIENCIKSLLELNYPKEKLEIILVNDRSKDRTEEIMKAYVSQHTQLKYYSASESTGRLKGKANALEQGLRLVTGEIVFTTDADIEVNRNWVNEILKYYDENTGVVAGYSVIIPDGFFNSLQSADWLYLLSVASGGDGVGVPISCVGNNMSYRKEAYDKIGGYSNIKFSVTEDFMLLQKIHKNSGFSETRFPVNNETKNITLPCMDLKHLFSQKKRWAAGGMGEFNFGIVVGAFSWLTGVIVLSGWTFLNIETYLFFLLAKLLTDTIFLLPAINEFKMHKVLLYMIPFLFYFAVYVLITSALLVIDRKVVWKDQKI